MAGQFGDIISLGANGYKGSGSGVLMSAAAFIPFGSASKLAAKVGTYEFEITHGITKSKSSFAKLKADIESNGIQQSIKFVEHNGKKFVVDGHHRLRAAKELGIKNIPVQLRFGSYNSVEDLIYSRY